MDTFPCIDGDITDVDSSQKYPLGEIRWCPAEYMKKYYNSSFEGAGAFLRYVKVTHASGLTDGQIGIGTISGGAGINLVKACDAAGSGRVLVRGQAMATVAQNKFAWLIVQGWGRGIGNGSVVVGRLGAHTSGQCDANAADGTEDSIGYALAADTGAATRFNCIWDLSLL